MPPAPGAPVSEMGPGGITYTPAADPVVGAMSPGGMPSAPGMPSDPGYPDYQQPSERAVTKQTSPTAGIVAALAGIVAIAGSLLQWGKGNVVGSNGVERAVIEVAGFDSSGLWAAVGGGVLLLAAALFFLGVPKQLNWAILSFVSGAIIVGAVVFSLIDIQDLSNRYATDWQAQGLSSAGDVISTQPDLGLWIAGVGGVLGVLAAPFVNRS